MAAEGPSNAQLRYQGKVSALRCAQACSSVNAGGHNLRSWCSTALQQWSVGFKQLLQATTTSSTKVLTTGGKPMLQPEQGRSYQLLGQDIQRKHPGHARANYAQHICLDTNATT